ncbi:family 20 glycosylhydrolase [Cellulomonas citrea]|uniref:family 20 glycosylhydrolase n=1 Tax=Cellulomonas citrea TaxID=1909423 RepID=UPI00135C5AE0|nr:family 20 glycosylhydrolase [Cellulomonas citrea]
MTVHVVPAPAALVELAGPPLLLGAGTRLLTCEAGLPAATLLAEVLARATGHALEVEVEVAGPVPGALRLELDDDLPVPVGGAAGHAPGLAPRAEEAYRLAVAADGLVLHARGLLGLLRGVATVRQLVELTGAGAWIPAVQVHDAPHHGWRGLSVDVARHFFGPADLEAVVDLLWLYKLDVLHLHLTDDQGWRIDLPSRPELVARSSAGAVDGDPGGAFDATQWAALVDYAAARGVVVVPEIDVPGHVNAALHACGDLVPGGEPTAQYEGIDVGFSQLTAGLPATSAFLGEVFTDLAAMTPGPYLHVGGDEVLTMAHEEYADLVGQAVEAVRDTGKLVVGWQEAATTAPAPGTVVQVWDLRQDPAPLVAAADGGALVLMSPATRAYLDLKYDATTPLGLEWAGHVDVRDAYDWDPATVLPAVPATSVVGVEAAVFTETLRTRDDLMWMLLPRLAALAEVGWTAPQARAFDDFRRRLARHPALWEADGLRWHPSAQIDWVG